MADKEGVGEERIKKPLPQKFWVGVPLREGFPRKGEPSG